MGGAREGQREAGMSQVSPALGVVLLVAAGCATATIPFQTLREPAWGYSAEDGKIYIYENRPACRLRRLGACRQLVPDRGEFYWLVSLVEPVWVGSTLRHYAHWIPRGDKAWIDRLAEALNNASGSKMVATVEASKASDV